ncbi:hypothetical protein EZI54_22130 [Marinobacter halodurans]|uniref:Uncharacterized protein n=1 Tax=Marinobacter halodurans TaxID=2528979 RepID=A0ABY1ZDZ1_9GAMM|nr:hypothetical protein [Marinobacter halodurans]TBW47796.1 hypothetical protein EZI54_22130 [Marinobacter halodurans]
MKTITRLVIGLLCLLAADATASLELEKDHGHWKSGMLATESGEPVFRAISDVERKTDVVIFFAVDMADDCETLNPNMLMAIPEGIDKSGLLNIGEFQARVDTRDVINGTWMSSANKMGDTIAFISLYTDKENQLIQDMKIGRTLRVKISFLEDGRDDFYLNFSLYGSSAAINRASALCNTYKKSDKEYFNNQSPPRPKQRKRDSEYFST